MDKSPSTPLSEVLVPRFKPEILGSISALEANLREVFEPLRPLAEAVSRAPELLQRWTGATPETLQNALKDSPLIDNLRNLVAVYKAGLGVSAHAYVYARLVVSPSAPPDRAVDEA